MAIDYESKIMAASYAAAIIRLTHHYGIPEQDVLSGTGISSDMLEGVDQRLTVNQIVSLTHNALNMTGMPHLGLVLGQNLNVTAHGMMGIAALSSKNTREVLTVITQFIRTRFTLISANHVVEDGVFSLAIEEDIRVAASLKKDTQASVAFRFALEAIFSSIHAIVQLLTQKSCHELKYEFAYPAPAYRHEYEAVFGADVRFDQPCFRISGTEAFADIPFSFYDEETLKIALRNCQSQMPTASLTSTPITNRVRSALYDTAGDLPSLEILCRQFNMSPRTLRRRLESEGTCFQDIVNDTRLELAKKHLSSSNRSIIDIASELKFSDPSYFARIFKRWTGLSPSEYRKKSL